MDISDYQQFGHPVGAIGPRPSERFLAGDYSNSSNSIGGDCNDLCSSVLAIYSQGVK